MPDGKQFLGGFAKGVGSTLPGVLSHLREKKNYAERQAEEESNKRISFLMQAARTGLTANEFIDYAEKIGATQEEIDIVQPMLKQGQYRNVTPLQRVGQYYYNWNTATHFKSPEGEKIEITPEMKEQIKTSPEMMEIEQELYPKEKGLNIYEERAIIKDWQEATLEGRKILEQKHPDVPFYEKKPKAAKPTDRTRSEYTTQVSWFNSEMRDLGKRTDIDPMDVGVSEPPDYEQNLKKLQYLKLKKQYLDENINSPYSKGEWKNILKEYKSMNGKVKKTITAEQRRKAIKWLKDNAPGYPHDDANIKAVIRKQGF